MKKNTIVVNKLHYYLTLILLVDKSVSHVLLLKNVNNLIQPRIAGGLQSDPQQFTYQVSLRRLDLNAINQIEKMQSFHYCGGALISDRWIVSAAHCTSGRNADMGNKIIVLGAHHLSEDGTWYGIDSVINHPEHHVYHNDISLVKTDRKVHFTNDIRPIKISKQNVGESGKALITGWGQDETGLSSLYLRYLYVDIISNEICHASHLPEYQQHIFDTTICTLGARKRGSCHGDSGGPLVKDGKLIGAISWGVPCAKGVPDQHTRISSYLDWIEENTGVVAA